MSSEQQPAEVLELHPQEAPVEAAAPEEVKDHHRPLKHPVLSPKKRAEIENSFLNPIHRSRTQFRTISGDKKDEGKNGSFHQPLRRKENMTPSTPSTSESNGHLAPVPSATAPEKTSAPSNTSPNEMPLGRLTLRAVVPVAASATTVACVVLAFRAVAKRLNLS